VHFMFLVNSSVQHVRLWRQFFAKAPRSSWRAWVHCTDLAACRRNGLFEELPGLVQVPTVPTAYCTDLVTAAVELLKNALAARAAPLGAIEKFALVSDSTLPVKSFHEVHQALTANEDSDICIAPADEWRGAHIDGIKEYLVKHSQWFVLNRDHAQTLANSWVPAQTWDNFLGWWSMPVKGFASAGESVRKVASSRFLMRRDGIYACTDEQAVFATLFGPFVVAEGGDDFFPGFGRLSMAPPKAQNTQGVCRTFTVFRNTKDLGDLTDSVMDVVKSDPATKTYQDEDWSHPMLLSCAGRRTLAALRASPFLFARKFGPDGIDAEEDAKHLSFTGERGHVQQPCSDSAPYESLISEVSEATIAAAPAQQLRPWGGFDFEQGLHGSPVE